MELYHLFFFVALLRTLANPIPETSLDPLLAGLILARSPENWSSVQPKPVDSFKQDQVDSFQITALDAIPQYQTTPVDSVQQDQTASADSVQQDPSAQFQIAAADQFPGLEQIDPNDDVSSYLDPTRISDDYLLAGKPEKPKKPKEPKEPKEPMISVPVFGKSYECPSSILPAHVCCSGTEQLLTGVPGLNNIFGPLILGYISVFNCYGCM